VDELMCFVQITENDWGKKKKFLVACVFLTGNNSTFALQEQASALSCSFRHFEHFYTAGVA